MKWLFVRHGVNDFAFEDYSVGKKQITAAAFFLKDQPFNFGEAKLLSSPKERACASAQIIGRILNLEVSIQSWLQDESNEMYDELCRFMSENQNTSLLILVGHEYAIERLLVRYRKSHTVVKNGSVHLIDPESLEARQLFEPVDTLYVRQTSSL